MTATKSGQATQSTVLESCLYSPNLAAATFSLLAESGVEHIQFTVIEIAEVQALLVVSAARTLDTNAVQAIITELKQAIEIAVLVGLRWRSSDGQSELTRNMRQE